MTAISTRLPECTIEYDTKKGRTTKHFEDANEAKAFFAKQDKAGKNPTVLADEPPAPKARKKKADAPATEATPAPAHAAPKVPGVAVNAKTRYYFAAKIIKKYGLEAGVTDAMIAELDAMYGKAPNVVESSIALRNAHHTLRSAAE